MQFESWKWLNPVPAAEENGILTIKAPAHTDWYINPVPVNGQMMHTGASEETIWL